MSCDIGKYFFFVRSSHIFAAACEILRSSVLLRVYQVPGIYDKHTISIRVCVLPCLWCILVLLQNASLGLPKVICKQNSDRRQEVSVCPPVLLLYPMLLLVHTGMYCRIKQKRPSLTRSSKPISYNNRIFAT